MSRPTVVCLTPIKNEAQILDRFIACASLWADNIIIADQQSDDGSADIARRYSKVTLLENPSSTYNETERQKLLLDAARRIPGPRLLIALDADEAFSATFMNSLEWESLLQSPTGTVALFQRVALLPGGRSCWLEGKGYWYPFAFKDDGSVHVGQAIHSARIPTKAEAPKIRLQDIKILHYQYTNWRHMESKHRWYQCWERLHRSSRGPIDIYRQYHHMYAVAAEDKFAVPKKWLLGYEQKGIDMTSVHAEPVFRWDREVLMLFAKHGPATFRREAIWDVDWSAVAEAVGCDTSQRSVGDPRSPMEKLMHIWLRKSQPYSSTLPVKLADECLKRFGW